METIKWIGAVLLAITGLGLFVAVVIAVTAASAFVWAVAFGLATICLTARLIKDLIDSKEPEDL